MIELNNYIVRNMTRSELNIALDFAAEEGWNPGLYDAEAFYDTDPLGFFMGFLDGKPISCISAVAYDNSFGFIGLYIIKPYFRNQGYIFRLNAAAIEHLNVQNIGVDGVISRQKDYAKLGFKFSYINMRYMLNGSFNNINNTRLNKIKSSLQGEIIKLSDIPFDILNNYDKKIFPTSRPVFLKNWISLPESIVLGVLKHDILTGYCVVRKCKKGYKVGPLFADDYLIAEALFLTAQQTVNNPADVIYMDVPKINSKAVELAELYKLKNCCKNPCFETARMYSQKAPNIPQHKIFGVTTLELG